MRAGWNNYLAAFGLLSFAACSKAPAEQPAVAGASAEAGSEAERAGAPAASVRATASQGGAGGRRAEPRAGDPGEQAGSEAAGASADAAPSSSAGTGGTGARAADGGKGGAPAAGSGWTAHAGGGAGGTAAGARGAATHDSPVDADPEATFLSETDQTPNDIALSPDRLGAEWLTSGSAGVRSTRAVMPGSGVYYFEAVAPVDYFDIGVAPASARLDKPAGAADGGGFSVNVSGYHAAAGSTTDFEPVPDATYGFVVDYRAEHPVLYLLAGAHAPGSLITTQTLTNVAQPLFIQLSGARRAAGYQVHLNTGNDVTNWPFTLDPAAALSAAGAADVASQLVPGWGHTLKQALNMPPGLQLEAAESVSIALGASVTLEAHASDPEDGDLTQRIAWNVLSEGNGPERVHGSGGKLSFQPRALGRHPIEVTVVDAGGKQARQTVTVVATGSLPQTDHVRLSLEPGLSGDGIQLDADGLRARWGADQKMGVRANQGLYGDFWYVEGHRLVPAWNQAIGLVIGNVSLNPYAFNVTPPSCSINGANVSVWQDLIAVKDTGLDASAVEYYGLAVDYRETSPVVYVIVGGKLVDTLHLTDASVPIYPMLYGNVTPSGAGWDGYDMEINFGGKPFHEDPAAVLGAAGISTSGLKLCWGNANSDCPGR